MSRPLSPTAFGRGIASLHITSMLHVLSVQPNHLDLRLALVQPLLDHPLLVQLRPPSSSRPSFGSRALARLNVGPR